MEAPEGEPCRGFMTCQCQETPKIPAKGMARDGQITWDQTFLSQSPFRGLFDHFVIGELKPLT